MSQSPQDPAGQPVPDGADDKSISRDAFRRRIAIACGATAGVTFILAGLMAGQSVLPNVLDELRDRDLLPVHVAGRAGTSAAGEDGAAGIAGSAESSMASSGSGSSPTAGAPGTPGTPGTRATEGETPNLILPGGINLSDVLDDPTAAVDDTLDTVKNFVKDRIDGAEDVLDDPTTLPEFIDNTVDGATDLIDDTTSTTVSPPSSNDLPVTVPTVPELPVTVPTVPELPVTVPPAPVSTTLPPAPVVPTSLPFTAPTVPTVPSVPATTVPAVLAPITNGLGL